VAAIAAVPQVAQASCSGSACAAFSATTNWNASSNQAEATLINKDLTRSVRVNFIMTVNQRPSNNFDVTLMPMGKVTKSISVFGGPSAGPKLVIEVATAEFVGGPGPTRDTKTLDTPRGPITYYADRASDGGFLTRGVDDFKRGIKLYEELAPDLNKFRDKYEKVGSLKDITAQIEKTMSKNPNLINDSRYAETIRRDIDNLKRDLRRASALAKNVAANLEVDESEREAAFDRDLADGLVKESAQVHQAINRVIDAIGAALNAAEAIGKVETGDELGAVVSLWNAAQKVTDMFGGPGTSDPLLKEADELKEKAKKISAKATAERFKNAEKLLADLKDELYDVGKALQQDRADYDNAVKRAQGNFDKSNAGKGSFNFTALIALIDEGKRLHNLAIQTRQATNGTLEHMNALLNAKKDWMVNPAEDATKLKGMFETANWQTNRVDQMRQEIETMQASLQETYAKAMQLAGP
jgi:hypothetical protein